MLLVWDDAKSFKRHIEAMRMFRRTHGAREIGRLTIRNMPEAYDIGISWEVINPFADARGKAVLVPMWKVTAPAGSRN